MSAYVVLEGGDGCGKSTQVRRLVDAFERDGRTVTCVREPGSTPLAESLRSLLLEDRGLDIDATTEALLFSAARRELIGKIVAPALARGDVVISDRSFVSTLVYQCLAPAEGDSGRVSKSAFTALTRVAHADVWPDAVIVLDVPVEVGRARLGARDEPDRIESRGVIFAGRVRNAFSSLADSPVLAELLGPGRVTIVDASAGPDDVERSVHAAVTAALAATREGR